MSISDTMTTKLSCKTELSEKAYGPHNPDWNFGSNTVLHQFYHTFEFTNVHGKVMEVSVHELFRFAEFRSKFETPGKALKAMRELLENKT